MSLLRTLSLFGLAATASFGLFACGDDGGGGGGCGGGGGGGGGVDDVDPAGEHNQYVVSEAAVPANATEATNLAQDLDDDGIPDNALGGLLGSLTATAGLDLQTGIDEQLSAGEFILLASVKATDIANAEGVGTFIFFGENPTPAACTDPADLATCGQHLDGSASFDLTATSPQDEVIVGSIVNGALTGGPGEVSIELPLGDTDPLRINLIGAKIEATIDANGISGGKLAGAITSEEVDSELLPTVQTLLVDLIAESCTPAGDDCGCEAGSTGEQVLGFFDTNGDCEVPLQELKDNSLIDSTLGNPDLDLLDANGEFNPNDDGVKDSLSFGIGFTAVGAAFEVPAAAQ